MNRLRVETIETFGGAVLGLTLLLVGWIIFTSNGFYSSLLFLAALILVPFGLLVLATALTGGFGESPWSIIVHYYRQRQQNKA